MLVLSSPSGAGKTSICKKILETEKNLVMSISYTTRPKRKSEKDGKDYFFVKKKIWWTSRKKFFCWECLVFDHFYGTPKNFIENNIRKGKDILFDIDWQGAQKLVDYSKNDVVSIFVLPPSNKILLERLKKEMKTVMKSLKKEWVKLNLRLVIGLNMII